MAKIFFLGKKILEIFLILGMASTVAITVHAKPDLKPLGKNIADTGSQVYNFQIKKFISKDQKRIYKVWLGIPKQKKNLSTGSTAIFMLDGNSVMSRLNEHLLQSMAGQDAPVLVAIGYETNLPFDSKARSLDYTPADETGELAADPRNPERLSGGSKAFRKIIIQEIAPWAEQQVKLDPKRKILWGHSYGGLFVLDSLVAGQYFSHYFAASPSLSWADQRIMKKLRSTKEPFAESKQLILMEGDITPQKNQKVSPNFNKDMIMNNRELLSYVHSQGVSAKLIIYPELSHGEVFGASLKDILMNKLF